VSMRSEMCWYRQDGALLPIALWCPGPGYRMISSGVAGGSIESREWVLNAQVPAGYSRTDPAVHVAELAAGLGLEGEGVGLLTAARVSDAVQCEDEGVRVAAAVGLRVPTWAAMPSGSADGKPVQAWRPGTINIIVSVPVPVRDEAYVNAVMTATEAKTQAGRGLFHLDRGDLTRRAQIRGRHGGCRLAGTVRPRICAGERPGLALELPRKRPDHRWCAAWLTGIRSREPGPGQGSPAAGSPPAGPARRSRA
jgi:adenosylcobinamide amidohydrolase